MELLAGLYFVLGLITVFVVHDPAAWHLGIVAGLSLAYAGLGGISIASVRKAIKQESLLTNDRWELNILAPLSWIAGVTGGIWLASH